eukprot:766513-Hanusia_phi.AAC.5
MPGAHFRTESFVSAPARSGELPKFGPYRTVLSRDRTRIHGASEPGALSPSRAAPRPTVPKAGRRLPPCASLKLTTVSSSDRVRRRVVPGPLPELFFALPLRNGQ